MNGVVGGQRAGPPCSQSQHPLPLSTALQRVPSAQLISYGKPLWPLSHGQSSLAAASAGSMRRRPRRSVKPRIESREASPPTLSQRPRRSVNCRAGISFIAFIANTALRTFIY